jgi:L-amino acid N-acyltransferase YncA
VTTQQRIYNVGDYPKEVTLRDGSKATIRPMVPEDADALLRFFEIVAVEDRYYLKEDVTDPEVIRRWAEEIDYSRALPLLAWSDGELVADATLHRTRTLARHHIGEVRVVVAEKCRGRGLGAALIMELKEVADRRGLELLTVELVAREEQAAIRVAESLGFTRLAVLPNHAKDLHGNAREVVVLELKLRPPA